MTRSPEAIEPVPVLVQVAAPLTMVQESTVMPLARRATTLSEETVLARPVPELKVSTMRLEAVQLATARVWNWNSWALPVLLVAARPV